MVHKVKPSQLLPPSSLMKEVGVDEAGRGCLAGPVVAAAVCLDSKVDLPVELNDSKKLKASDRDKLYDWITAHAKAWAVGEASNTEVDEVNVLQATYLAMHRAIDKIKVTPDRLMIDGNRFKPYEKIEHECVIGGDAKVASIAAASIIAKVHRDRLMADLDRDHPAYGWKGNKGYPTKKHKEAIRCHGPSPWHRMTFAGVRSD